MPVALKLGISYFDFWKMNPRILAEYQKVKLEDEEKELYKMKVSAWYHGIYQISAIQAALEPKKCHYPDCPKYEDKDEDKVEKEDEENADLIEGDDYSSGDLAFLNWISAYNRKFHD